MIWGGISIKGLIPRNAPLFMCDLKSEWVNNGNPKTRGVTGDMYAYMVTQYAVPAVIEVYGQRAVWQDDPATIHRTAAGLEASDAFSFRIPHEEQAPKMANVWPIKNVWAIVKDSVKTKEPKSKAQLKRVIDADKGLCKRLVMSIPSRLEAVITVGWAAGEERGLPAKRGIKNN